MKRCARHASTRACPVADAALETRIFGKGLPRGPRSRGRRGTAARLCIRAASCAPTPSTSASTAGGNGRPLPATRRLASPSRSCAQRCRASRFRARSRCGLCLYGISYRGVHRHAGASPGTGTRTSSTRCARGDTTLAKGRGGHAYSARGAPANPVSDRHRLAQPELDRHAQPFSHSPRQPRSSTASW